MNVKTITMRREAAQEKLAAYRAQLRRRKDEEYEAVMAGYEVLASGEPLLNTTVEAADFDEPALPSCDRCDRPMDQIGTNSNGGAEFICEWCANGWGDDEVVLV